jgi:hypothetical protein
MLLGVGWDSSTKWAIGWSILFCTNTIILLINIFWEKMPDKWMTKD